jgi:hypothetical protein
MEIKKHDKRTRIRKHGNTQGNRDRETRNNKRNRETRRHRRKRGHRGRKHRDAETETLRDSQGRKDTMDNQTRIIEMQNELRRGYEAKINEHKAQAQERQAEAEEHLKLAQERQAEAEEHLKEAREMGDELKAGIEFLERASKRLADVPADAPVTTTARPSGVHAANSGKEILGYKKRLMLVLDGVPVAEVISTRQLWDKANADGGRAIPKKPFYKAVADIEEIGRIAVVGKEGPTKPTIYKKLR